MRTEKPAIILYFLCCLLCVFAAAIHSENLMVIAKPIVVPAIFFYYLSVKREPFNWMYALFMFLSFAGDTIVLLELENPTLYIMIPFFVSYLVLLRLIISDVRKLQFNLIGVGLGIFIAGLLVATAFTLIQFLTPENQILKYPILVYGLLLGIQAALALYHYQISSSNMSFYLAMTALFNCASDIFYVIFFLVLQNRTFESVDIALQLFSYYFVVKYFILRKN